MKAFYSAFSILLITLISYNQGNAQLKYSYTKWKVDTNGKKIGKSEFKSFDDQNNLIKWIQYFENGQCEIDSFSYEFKDHLKRAEFRYTNGKLWTKTLYIYGNNNKLLETKSFTRDNKIEANTKHKHWSNFEVIENYSDDKLYSIDTLTYNNKKEMISKIQYMPDGTWFQRHKYKYNSDGILQTEQAEANPEFDGIGLVENRYVIKRNRTSQAIVIFPDKSKEHYIYEYNKE